MKRSPTLARLLTLFGIGLLAFDFPLLQLWATPLALFLLWAGLIAVLAWVLERAGDD